MKTMLGRGAEDAAVAGFDLTLPAPIRARARRWMMGFISA